MRNTDIDREHFTVGTPFDPFGSSAEDTSPTARIVPFQFDYPTYPLGFSLIRDTGTEDQQSDDTEKP